MCCPAQCFLCASQDKHALCPFPPPQLQRTPAPRKANHHLRRYQTQHKVVHAVAKRPALDTKSRRTIACEDTCQRSNKKKVRDNGGIEASYHYTRKPETEHTHVHA
uniref:Uncharacterized protein n=1 Tax=Eutreptiella gymnastica TaxID=73025 RepID=A0A7S1NLZ3_9EUGL